MGMRPIDVGHLVDAWRDREERLDFRAGVALSAIALMKSGGKSRCEPADFYHSIRRPPPPTDEEVEARVRAVLLGR
jgi:hypothetical protein